jgi:hypothetical protein
VKVTPVNDPPRASIATVETNEDTPYEGNLAGSDPDGDALVFKLTSQGRLGKAELLDRATGAWRYTPRPDVFGDDEVAFEVSDATATAKGVMKLHVVAVNDAPVMQPREVRTLEDTPVEGKLTATDVDGDALSFSIVSQPGSGRVTLLDGAAGTYRFEPAKDFNGDDAFTAQASDGQASSKPAQVRLHVEPQNDPPTVASASLTTSEDTPLRGKLEAHDVDGDALAYRLLRQPQQGKVTLEVSTGEFVYTPARDFNGADSFLFSATDPSAASSGTGVISITVTPVDDPPVGVAESMIVPRRGSVINRLHGHDPDGKPLTFSIVRQPARGHVQLNDARTGEFTFSSDGVGQADLRFSFAVFDGTLTSEPVEYVLQPQNF